MRAFMIVAASMLAVGVGEANASCQPVVDSDCPCDAVFGDSAIVTPTIGGASGDHGWGTPPFLTIRLGDTSLFNHSRR